MSVLKIDTTTEGSCDRPKYELLEAGKFDLEITNKPEKSDSKNPSSDGVNYGKLTVELKDVASGKTVRDYLSLHPKMTWKLNQFAISAGVIKKGESLELDPADLQGRVVTAMVGQRTYPKNDGSGEQGLANEIKSYIFE